MYSYHCYYNAASYNNSHNNISVFINGVVMLYKVEVLMLVHKLLGVVTVPSVVGVFFLLKENFILWLEHIQYLFLQVAYVLVSRS